MAKVRGSMYVISDDQGNNTGYNNEGRPGVRKYYRIQSVTKDTSDTKTLCFSLFPPLRPPPPYTTFGRPFNDLYSQARLWY